MSAVVKEQLNLLVDENEAKWHAVVAREASFDGQFVFAVSSTGIYCRPSCPSRRPHRERVSFFELPEAAERAGFRACKRCEPRNASIEERQIELIKNVCRMLDDAENETTTLASLSVQTGVSSFHLQRTFKKVMGVTPRQYSEGTRLNRFKDGAREGKSVTAAMYDAGFGSSSRLYEQAISQLGMTPATYGKGGRGASISYAVVDCFLGALLVAITNKGVCSVKLGDVESGLTEDLKREFPAASFRRDQKLLSESVRAVVDHLEGKSSHINLPLDIKATAFQRQVWGHLRRIPAGQTRSYSEVARGLGQEKAVRAVARACATNPVALVIPCHRVIREDKSLGGYRWGLERKKKLLEAETARLR